MCPISKDIFSKCIRSMRRAMDFQCGIINLVNDYNKKLEDGDVADMGSMMYPDCSQALTDLLETVMHDDEGLICYYCWDTNFGRDEYAEIKTIDELWDRLTTGGNEDNV